MNAKFKTVLIVSWMPCMMIAQTRLQLSASLSNAIPTLTWNNPLALLQEASSLNGNWVTVTNAINPYVVPPTNSAAFFRLRVNCVSPLGIVSWWTGDGSADDLIGLNNGTLLGAGGYLPGEVGPAFSLDGSSAWVDIPSSDSLNPTGPFSVECWIQANPEQSYPQSLIVDKSHGFVDGTGWAIQTSPDGTAAFFYGIGGPTGDSEFFPFVATKNSVLDGQWHHLAGVWTGTQLEIYEDSVLQNTLSQTNLPANNTRDVEIGRSWGGGSPQRFFNGLIDEVTYFDRALSSNDVSDIFNAGAAGKCKH